MDLKYLELLAKEYPTAEAVSTEIINLSAIRSLPKGTEYFFSDLHGEYEAFLHLLKSASGMIRSKIDMIFGKTLNTSAREELASLIYYPEQRMKLLRADGELDDEWRKLTIYRLIQVCEAVSAKYTRSRVRKRMPQEFSYVLDELLNVTEDINKDFYYEEIIHSILDTGIADSFITALCYLIQSLSIDQLHIIGDIFDRGPRADIILDELIRFENVDIQWGNHDISWMGAASGNRALMANVVRIATSYNSFDQLEDGYGINLRALSEFAGRVYQEDPCTYFAPHTLDRNKYDPVGLNLAAKMHKAIAVIQFKLEGQLLARHPEYNLTRHIGLNNVNFQDMTVDIEGKSYPMRDTYLPTIDPKDPCKLTQEEAALMDVLAASFQHSEKLQKHIKFLYSHGSMYRTYNNNLMYHGCIPMDEKGNFRSYTFTEGSYSGKAMLDYINKIASRAYYGGCSKEKRQCAIDFMWYLWCGQDSPLYGKDKMTAFEHYFIEDKSTYKETYDPYYRLNNQVEICDKILREFGLDPTHGHIINGHVPVKKIDGDSPIKASGKLFVIDGGISKAYQSRTGIAGYTLIYDSHSLRLAEHRPFHRGEQENTPDVQVVERMPQRVNIADTDNGKAIAEEIQDLRELLKAYRGGMIQEGVGRPYRYR